MEGRIARGRWIEKLIRTWVASAPENTLGGDPAEPAWDEPIVGFARGDDPLFETFKEVVGPFHWTPAEVVSDAFPGQSVSAAELTVITWVLPQTAATRRDSRKQRRWPAERWARARVYGEQGNRSLAEHVVRALLGAGWPAAAPMLSPRWAWQASERFGFASTWSERHAAYAAGLGTFGLCDGLITPAGKAVRIGSAVARVDVSPSEKRYPGHRSNCLFFSGGTCGRCIERCPAGALSARGHDKTRCREFLFGPAADRIEREYGFKGYACGLCQTGVPCETRIPAGAGRASPCSSRGRVHK